MNVKRICWDRTKVEFSMQMVYASNYTEDIFNFL